jgi:hypothetical protein
MINQTNNRFGIPERYESYPSSLETTPSAALPFY